MICNKNLIAVALLLSLAACKVGPNYKRPPVTLPDQYRGLAPDATTQPGAASLADSKWFTVFQDPVLEGLIKEALANNYDIRIAATRVVQAQAIVGITRADQFPQVSAGGAIQNQRSAAYPGGPTFTSFGINMSYIVDFWGQYRRATEAARADLLATEYAQDLVRSSLVSDVASAYFSLRQFDMQLDYSKKTLETDKEMLRINTVKYQGGESAKTDVLQAQVLVEQAEAQIIDLTRRIEQSENVISVLLGRNPGPIARGTVLSEQPHIPEVPAGIPSSILAKRPDVRRAEQLLVSANASVGVAKAAFFPQFSLTGSFGAQSTAITSFLNGPATFWSAGGQVLQPLFQGGRIKSNYRLAWSRRDEAELSYKQTVQLAVTDVSNNLVGYGQARQFRMKLEEQTATYYETARLANVRFLGGYTSFLEVLVTQQQYFDSQLALAQAWNSELQSYVQLYKALGGGWEN